jgi:hypothetical protein
LRLPLLHLVGPPRSLLASHRSDIRTDLSLPQQKNKDFSAMVEQRTAAHRWGNSEDLRGALLLLASDAGAYITAVHRGDGFTVTRRSAIQLR